MLEKWCRDHMLNVYGFINCKRTNQVWFEKTNNLDKFDELKKINDDIALAVKKIIGLVNICDCGKEVISPRIYCSLHCANHSKVRAKNISNSWTEDSRKRQKSSLLISSGFESNFHNPKVQSRVIDSVKLKYDVDNISQLQATKDKKKNTVENWSEEFKSSVYLTKKTGNREKYGCDSHTQAHWSKELIEAIDNKLINVSGIYDPIFNSVLGLSNVYRLINKFRPELIVGSCSSLHKFFCEHLNSLGIEYLTNNRKIIAPLELDIVIPSLKLAFEINGTYWHNADRQKSNYHQQKSILANAGGYKLIHIYEYQNKEDVIAYINNLVDRNNKISARSCEVKEVTRKVAKNFFDQYHKSKSSGANVSYGLFHDGVLIQCMSFGVPRFSNESWEIIRFASQHNSLIRGGASKLFSAFKKNHDPSSVITYSDLDLGVNTVYEKMGFTFSHISEPSYVWVGKSEVLSRYQCQPKLLEKRFNKPVGTTESEFMKSIGYLKVYNSGNQVFKYYK